ncbi:MAG: hypothetical protein QM739_08370 [Propionivibrio sp.]
MTIELTDRQREILQKLLLNDKRERKYLFNKLANGQLTNLDIEEFCSLINDVFLMEGLLPNYEPNEYGLELEELLDSINRSRIRS